MRNPHGSLFSLGDKVKINSHKAGGEREQGAREHLAGASSAWGHGGHGGNDIEAKT